jgi:PAS domain S-box-containing protein
VIGRLWRRSLAARLSAAVLALTITAIVLVSLTSYRRAEVALRERLVERLQMFADEDAAELEQWHARQRAAVLLVSRLNDTRRAPAFPMGRIPGVRYIEPLDPSVLAANELVLLTVPGARVIRASNRARLDTYAVDQLYYERGRVALYTQTVYPSGADGRPTMTVAAPVRDLTDETVIGVLAADLDLSEFEKVLERRTGDVPVDAFLVNRFAEFVSSSRFGRTDFRRGVHSEGIDRALTGENGVALYTNHEGEPVVGAWRWIPELELALILESPQAAAFAPARELLVNVLLVGLGVTLVLTLGIVAITRRFTSPVLAVARAATAVAGGDFSTTAPVAGTTELASLARAFNTMTGRLRTLYEELGSQVRATRNALDEAEASRTILQDVVNNAATLVLVVDLDDRIRLANTAFAGLTGAAAEEIPGVPLPQIVEGTAAAGLYALVARARERGMPVEQELELAADGGAHAWQAVAFPMLHADGHAYATGLIATDLTERARAESERRERDASVQQAQKLESLGVMAGGIAHDFNNLLSAILGNVDLARALVDDPAEVKEALDQIAAASRRASELTRQMLAYAGRASLRREVVDARAVFMDIVPLVRAAQSKKVEFVVEPMPEPLWVELDPAQLSQVTLNLLTNAAEAIGDDAGTVTLSADREPPPAGSEHNGTRDWVRFSIADSGSGIPEAVRSRIFDPFFTTKDSGRGLGLSAVRGIIRSLGGVLALDSAPGRGTRFNIHLPAVGPPPRPGTPRASAPIVVKASTALVVDDEASLRRIARRTLEEMGFTVVEAVDGIEALERFREHADRVRIVILDLTMPRMGGAEVLAELRRTHQTLPVIIASGYDRAAEIATHGNHDRTSFLQKPFGVAAFREAVAAALA